MLAVSPQPLFVEGKIFLMKERGDVPAKAGLEIAVRRAAVKERRNVSQVLSIPGETLFHVVMLALFRLQARKGIRLATPCRSKVAGAFGRPCLERLWGQVVLALSPRELVVGDVLREAGPPFVLRFLRRASRLAGITVEECPEAQRLFARDTLYSFRHVAAATVSKLDPAVFQESPKALAPWSWRHRAEECTIVMLVLEEEL